MSCTSVLGKKQTLTAGIIYVRFKVSTSRLRCSGQPDRRYAWVRQSIYRRNWPRLQLVGVSIFDFDRTAVDQAQGPSAGRIKLNALVDGINEFKPVLVCGRFISHCPTYFNNLVHRSFSRVFLLLSVYIANSQGNDLCFGKCFAHQSFGAAARACTLAFVATSGNARTDAFPFKVCQRIGPFTKYCNGEGARDDCQ